MTGAATHQVGAGIGIALLPADAADPQEAMRKADVALYRAKAERRSALRFFGEHMDQQVRERGFLEDELRAALRDGGIGTIFQSRVDLRTGRVVGFKASLCWVHPGLGEIPATRFIPIAEEAGLIHELADRLLVEACATAAQWPSEVELAVDLLPGQTHDADLQKRIVDTLGAAGIAASRLEIAVPESVLVRDFESVESALGGLRCAGVKIAVTGFGTGYSSLYHLRNFKLDKIRIDSSFIQSLGSEEDSATIVRALVGLGEGLGLTIAADGIATPAQKAALLESGCSEGEGSLFSETVSADSSVWMAKPCQAAAAMDVDAGSTPFLGSSPVP